MNAVSLIALIISVAIPAFAIYLIFTFDLYGTGKGNTVLTCVAWGVFGAFGLAYIINTAVIGYVNQSPALESYRQSGLAEFFSSGANVGTYSLGFLTTSRAIAPFIEEVLKALILFYFIQQPRFRYFVDGAVYGFAAGIGFAMTENIFYILNNEAALALAISRVLSASLMHATASAVVGIALGLSRRQGGVRKLAAPAEGILFAFAVHFIYNNLLFILASGPLLLLIAIGIGVGGGTLIAVFMNWGLNTERQRFAETLGIGSGVTSAERKAVQQLGSESIELILDDMAAMFGKEKADMIRQLLVLQANLGILKNNLQSPVGDRLRKAWQEEIDQLKQEMDVIRSTLGAYTMTLLRSLLPEDDSATWTELTDKVADYDPNHVHKFDLFMKASALSGTISPEELERISNHLHRISIFKNVELAALDNLSRAVTIKNYSHGELLFDKGDEGDYMYLIDRGYIDILTVDEAGEQSLLRTYQAGDVVGELALLDGQPRSARARANGPLRVMMLSRNHFNMFIQSRPKVILAVLQFLADRVRYTTDAVKSDNLPQTVVRQHDPMEDTSEISPEKTDTVLEHQAPTGVFGRIATMLDEIEGKKKSAGESGES